jgi:Ni/Fe-hydrogenase subunit HybB-like protein
MSLEPDWYSTIWGLLFVVAQALGTLALVIALLALLAERRPFAGVLTIPIFHDLGNLLMAFTMLWAYISFSQYLLIWSANLPEEATHYVARTNGGWKYVALALVIFHFFVPFLLLLWRKTKRTVGWLATVAGWLLFMRLVDLFWVIGPGLSGHGGHSPAEGGAHGLWHAWMFPAAAAAIGGLFVFAFVWQLRRRPLLPLNDPRLLADAGGHH